MATEVLHAVDDEVVEIARDLIRFDTSNYGKDADGPGENLAAEYVVDKLSEVGLDSEWVEPFPGRATVVANWAPPGTDMSLKPLMIHVHTDVVPAAASDWTHPPFAAEVADGCIWGRGAVDMKDMDAMVLSVVRARIRDGRAPRRPIRLVFFADEEASGFKGSQWVAANRPDLLRDCEYAISEVGGFSLTIRDDLRLYLVESAEKGLLWLKLIADGTAGHGSMRNYDNAVTELAAAVGRIGNYQWPTELHPAQEAFIRELEDSLGVPIEASTVEATLSRLGGISRMIGACMSHTANPTRLDAGYMSNVIPSQATATIDTRFLPGKKDELLAKIRELAGEKVRVETISDCASVETEFAGGLADAMQAALIREDPAAKAVPYMLSAGTDAKNFDPAWGIKCFGFCPLQLPPDLDFNALFHGVDERIPIDSLKFGARVLDHFLDLA
ncbi:MAG: M20/M25/M40 family metallo-hydrolase [Propionibacteriaceae bacterium]|jgi:acetylornithine deacetylase/succinyl-diaminopimelate desuccinylase-like protein|nr:M20/M25/M40 family metallo-hydrolase [Propionibacteriaceae bacterium]